MTTLPGARSASHTDSVACATETTTTHSTTAAAPRSRIMISSRRSGEGGQDFPREEIHRARHLVAWNAGRGHPEDQVAEPDLLLEALDLTDAFRRVAQDDPIVREPLDGELARRTLHDRMRPAEVRVLERPDEAGSRDRASALDILGDKDVAHERDLAGGRVAARFLPGLAVQAYAPRDLVELRRRAAEPRLAQTPGAPDGRIDPPAEPDGRARALGRPRIHGRVRDAIVPSGVRDLLFGPEPLDQGHGLVEAARALLERHVEGRELLGGIPSSHAENEAARRDHVHHRALLGDGERPGEREQEHGGPEAHRASAVGDRGEPDERRRIERSIVVVLAEPDRVEPRRFGALAFADGVFKISPGLQRAQPELHVDVLLVSSSRPRTCRVGELSLTFCHRKPTAATRVARPDARKTCA